MVARRASLHCRLPLCHSSPGCQRNSMPVGAASELRRTSPAKRRVYSSSHILSNIFCIICKTNCCFLHKAALYNTNELDFMITVLLIVVNQEKCRRSVIPPPGERKRRTYECRGRVDAVVRREGRVPTPAV